MGTVLALAHRTPVQTFILCPLAVFAFDGLAAADGRASGGAAADAWGYLQYKLVGRYRGPRAGGGPGMENHARPDPRSRSLR